MPVLGGVKCGETLRLNGVSKGVRDHNVAGVVHVTHRLGTTPKHVGSRSIASIKGIRNRGVPVPYGLLRLR